MGTPAGAALASACGVIRSICALTLCGCLAAACGSTDSVGSDEQDVKVDTEAELAWQQYVANLEFARGYQPTCVSGTTAGEGGAPEDQRPRVLVTGFGRFQSNRANATGEVVSELLDGLTYPLTDPPAYGQIDPPAPQTAVALGTVELPGVGEVDLCGMVVPVFWDLAAVLVLKEIEAFSPDFVLLNGIAGGRQPLWLELGSINRARALEDGSDILMPIEEGAPLIPTAPEEEYARPLLLSWHAVRAAAEQAITSHAADEREGTPLSDVLHGVRFAGYPRSSNTYLCNNTAYTVGYLMDHHGEAVRLMEASHPREGYDDGLDVTINEDHSTTPRVFVHWPSNLEGDHIGSAAEVMSALIAGQVDALVNEGELPSPGDNAIAEVKPDATGGDTY